MSEQTGKGRATPSRKEAEAARKAALKQPTSRKEQAKREREARAALREKQQAALKGGGDDKYLPLRDRGPVRRFARDYIDRRRNLSDYIFFGILIALVGGLTGVRSVVAAANAFWMVIIVATFVDEIILVRGLKKQLKARFPDEDTRGIVLYAVLRSTQPRRFRLPKPAVDRGAELPTRY